MRRYNSFTCDSIAGKNFYQAWSRQMGERSHRRDRIERLRETQVWIRSPARTLLWATRLNLITPSEVSGPDDLRGILKNAGNVGCGFRFFLLRWRKASWDSP